MDALQLEEGAEASEFIPSASAAICVKINEAPYGANVFMAGEKIGGKIITVLDNDFMIMEIYSSVSAANAFNFMFSGIISRMKRAITTGPL